MADIQIEKLAQRPDALDAVARWIDTQWGAFSGRTLAETRARFADEPVGDALPTSFVAMDGGVPLGIATLRARDSVDWDPANTPWICNVYVPPAARGRGIAALLCHRLEEEARTLGHPSLFLASLVAGGSVYERIGYRVYGSVPLEGEIINLMKRDLGPGA